MPARSVACARSISSTPASGAARNRFRHRRRTAWLEAAAGIHIAALHDGVGRAFASVGEGRGRRCADASRRINATFPEDAESVILPPLPDSGLIAEDSWEKFGEAQAIEEAVFTAIEEGLTSAWR